MGVGTRSGTAVQSAAACELRAGGDCVSVRRRLYCSMSTVSSCATIHSTYVPSVWTPCLAQAGLLAEFEVGVDSVLVGAAHLHLPVRAAQAVRLPESAHPHRLCAPLPDPIRQTGQRRAAGRRLRLNQRVLLFCLSVCLSVSLSLLYLYHILFPVLVLSRSPLSTITVLHLVAQSLHLLANYPTRKQYTKTITPKIPVVLLNLFTIRFIPRYLVSRLFFEYFVWYFIIGNWLKYFTVLY